MRITKLGRDNGKRLGWSSVMLRAAAGVAQESNPGMTVFATVVADVWGRWVGILSLFPPRSFLFHLFVSLLLSSCDSCLHSLTPAAAMGGRYHQKYMNFKRLRQEIDDSSVHYKIAQKIKKWHSQSTNSSYFFTGIE